jgi:hypothetical protein
MKNLSVAVKTYAFKKKGASIVKIGRTKNIEKRLRTLTSMSGCELDVIFTYDGDIELYLHTKFAHLRKIGEWFDDASGEIESFLKSESNVTVFDEVKNLIQKIDFDAEKAMVAIDSKFFKDDFEPQSALLNGSVGGNIARELYDKLPTHLYYEELVYGFLGCPALAFIFDDAVYYVGPYFGIKFNSLDEYIEYHKECQQIFAVENNTDVDALASWDDFAVFMRNHAPAMIEEITRDND